MFTMFTVFPPPSGGAKIKDLAIAKMVHDFLADIFFGNLGQNFDMVLKFTKFQVQNQENNFYQKYFQGLKICLIP